MHLHRWAPVVAFPTLLFGLLTTASATPASPLLLDHPTPTPLWAGTLDHAPVPLAEPLASAVRSAFDGNYARENDGPPQWWACRRCADYRPSGGSWRLRFDRGVMRILYDVTGWKDIASFEANGDGLRIFNDPVCPSQEGTYRWQLRDGALTLLAVEDTCAFGLRAENLTASAWLSCAPPDLRAAVSDAWPRPLGCGTGATPIPTPSASSFRVTIASGDARKASPPPGLIVAANAEDVPPPQGIEIDRADGVVPYGLNLILWKGGPWVELSTDIVTDGIGVQFLGPASMGAARVIFDGEEVWRGEVTSLGAARSDYVQYGGYLEVSGLASGRHALRVEHGGLDSRPVTVMFFGLR